MKKEEISSKTISDTNMYDELIKEFEYKLSFKLLRQHKDEIMEWLKQAQSRATQISNAHECAFALRYACTSLC